MFEFGAFSRRKIKPYRQTETAECGLVCLAMIANFHGCDMDMVAMRRRLALSARGATLRSIIECADKLGLNSRAVKLPLEGLNELQMPAILHWNLNHFVVLEEIKAERGLIHDPAGRSRWMNLTEISNHFTGVALELSPSVTFEPIRRQDRLSLRQIVGKVIGLPKAVFQGIVLSLLIQLFALVGPYYGQVLVDSALPASDLNLVAVLGLVFIGVASASAISLFLRDMVLMNAGTVVGYVITLNIWRKLFRLPVDWFEKRSSGDILSRFQSAAPIQRLLTEGTVGGLIDGLFAVLTLILMIAYSPALAAIALLALLAYVVARTFLYRFEREAETSEIIAAGREQTTLIESLHGIVTLRLNGAENIRLALWQSRAVDALNARARLARLGIWRTTIYTFLFALENVASLGIAVLLVIKAEGFTLGMIFAFTAYKTQFLLASRGLVDRFTAFKMLNVHLDRLSDIALTDDDESFVLSAAKQTELKGRLELSHISFRYSDTDPFVLKDVDLVIEPGEHVAITGASGCGKTTLLKIALGLLKPSSGQLRVDDHTLAEFGHKSYYRQLGAVLQNDCLFAGTIADNITMFSEVADMDAITEAACASAIHNDIIQMPMKYETFIGDMGSTLSGGQKQRILLARALYKRPKFLIMDEGTSHLDAGNEHIILETLRSLGITVLIVAHRRETIEAADRILMLKNGYLHPQETFELQHKGVA